MTTVLTNSTEPVSHERVKEYFYLAASIQLLAEHDQPITMTTLQEWKSSGHVCGPLSRDEFVQRVRERQIDAMTIVWEVWDGVTVWPYLQAEKLTLFREVNRVTLPSVKSPSSSPVAEPTADASADELLGSMLQESQVELPLTKPGLVWRIPLIGWLLALCGWKPRYRPTTALPANANSESVAESASVSLAHYKANSTVPTANRESTANNGESELRSAFTPTADPNLNGFGGLSLDGLEDAGIDVSRPHVQSATDAFQPSAPEVDQLAQTGGIDGQLDQPPTDGQLHNAIANAVDYFDAKTANSLAHQDKLQAEKPRLRDQLLRAVLRTGRFVVWPFRGIIALAEKAVASERSLVTGESFQRLDASLRRGLTHPLTWGVVAGGAFFAILYLVMAMQPDRPDELDFYAIKKLKEAQEAIRAVRATQPDEPTWAEFSQTLTAELTVLKEALQKDMQINRPVKEGLYLAIEYRLPRILKEGRLKASAAEGEFGARIQDAERQIKAAPK